MREILNINKGWKFSKGVSSVPSKLPDDWQDKTAETIIIAAKGILPRF